MLAVRLPKTDKITNKKKDTDRLFKKAYVLTHPAPSAPRCAVSRARPQHGALSLPHHASRITHHLFDERCENAARVKAHCGAPGQGGWRWLAFQQPAASNLAKP